MVGFFPAAPLLAPQMKDFPDERVVRLFDLYNIRSLRPFSSVHDLEADTITLPRQEFAGRLITTSDYLDDFNALLWSRGRYYSTT